MVDAGGISELIEKIRNNEIKGKVEITFEKENCVKKIQLSNRNNITDAIKKVKLGEPDFKNTDFSGLKLAGSDFSGLDLSGSNFSGTSIVGSDFSYSRLQEVNFYGSLISQSSFANSNYFNNNGAILTGSVNLYNSSTYSPNSKSSGGDWSSPYGQFETINNPHPKGNDRENYGNY